MEEAQEEKREWNQCNEKCSSKEYEPEDGRKSNTSQISDESEEKLRTFGVMKENEQINNELEGCPNQSNPNAASDDGAKKETFNCEVCGKQFGSSKAVYGHTKIHTGKNKATEVGSNGCEEEGSYSLRAKKHTSTFKLPRKPDSGSPQNPVPNGKSHRGEASSSRQIERDKSRNKRDVDVHGHMKLLSGKRKAAEVGSNGCEEEGLYSLRGRKLTSTFKLPRKPDNGSPQDPVPNGKPHRGEASSSRQIEREKSRNKRDVDVHGHMKLHSGKTKVAEGGSLRTRKHTSITFKPPRKPNSDAPQNPERNGKSQDGEASRSRQMERDRSSSVSRPLPVQGPDYQSVFDQVMIEIAPYLLKLSDGFPDRHFVSPNHPNDDPRKE